MPPHSPGSLEDGAFSGVVEEEERETDLPSIMRRNARLP